jgi:hypothetical protein
MRMYKCPHCRTLSIPLKDKYRAGVWGIIYCKHCKARLCAYPYLLGALYVVYTWDVMWFFGLYYFTRNPLDFVYMILGWVTLDALNVAFMPLAVMKNSRRS